MANPRHTVAAAALLGLASAGACAAGLASPPDPAHAEPAPPRFLSADLSGPSRVAAAPPERIAFSLEDVNPSSSSYGTRVSPPDFAGSVSAWYFSAATCTYCRWQYSRLVSLQKELDADHPNLGIRLLAVNRAGYESGLGKLTPLGDLPVLQDTHEEDAWGRWSIRYRDVVLLDAAGTIAARFNLSERDLGKQADYRALRDLMLRIAQRTDSSETTEEEPGVEP